MFRLHRLRSRPASQLTLEAWIERAVRKNARAKEEGTLLHLALMDSRMDIVDHFLERGARVDVKNRWGLSPLIIARLLNRESALLPIERFRQLPLLIYRNKDRAIHSLSLDEFERKLGITYIDTLEFQEADHLSWVIRKCNQRLKRKSCYRMDRWMNALYREKIDAIRRDRYYIRWISSDIGYGVFAAQSIPSLTYVGEYTGVIKKRCVRKQRDNDYIFGYSIGTGETPLVIDAEKRGNFSRFINHSYYPNLTSRSMIFDGVSHIILFTNRWVQRGEQLTYDYGKHYWKSRFSPDPL